MSEAFIDLVKQAHALHESYEETLWLAAKDVIPERPLELAIDLGRIIRDDLDEDELVEEAKKLLLARGIDV